MSCPPGGEFEDVEIAFDGAGGAIHHADVVAGVEAQEEVVGLVVVGQGEDAVAEIEEGGHGGLFAAGERIDVADGGAERGGVQVGVAGAGRAARAERQG